MLACLICGVEYLLRSIANSINEQQATKTHVRESAGFESYEVMKDLEPYRNSTYFTPEFWSEKLTWANQGSALKYRHQLYGILLDAKDFTGKYLSASDGRRTTTDAPPKLSGRVLLFGGSTMYCHEVPDDKTIASYLQRQLNDRSLNLAVENYGIGGATVIARIKKLYSLDDLGKNDSVIFLFGDNDFGWRKYYFAQPLVFKPIRMVGRRLRLAQWMYFELSRSYRVERATKSAIEVISALETTSSYLSDLNIPHVFILQPNIYTKQSRNEYENEIVRRFGPELSETVGVAYSVFRTRMKPPFVSAENLMDNTYNSVYLDWSHVSAPGNELIANFMAESDIFRQ